MRILCIRLDKVTAITDMLQHERQDLCLLGLTPDSFESVFMACEIKRMCMATSNVRMLSSR